jgi:histidinol-phosphate aminotransferase
MKENSEKIILYGFDRGPDYASDTSRPEGVTEIDCGLGHSPFGYPPEVDNVLRHIDRKMLNEYPADPYSDKLADNVQERFGLLNKTKVFFGGAGSYGLLASILSDMASTEALNKGVEVVGVGPQFTNISVLAKRAQIDYRPLTPEMDLPYEEKIEQLIKERKAARTAAFVYIDNPNNPTGAAVSLSTLERLAKATSNGDILIVDEAYGDSIADSNSAFKLVEEYKHLAVIRSISKTVGLASPRLGYMAMSKPLEKVYEEMRLVFVVDRLTQVIAEKVLDPALLADFLPKVRSMTVDAKMEFIAMLAANDVKIFETEPEVSILLAQGGKDFYNKLFSLGISTEDGATFIPTHPAIDNSYVRFRVPAASKDIREVGRRIATIKK